ncbi:telomere-protecting terminal protein Tpg [Streptomyces sp. NPDC047706]|uniref:telomere-protecting terminal protein Tpg n=1 Tax=Streptomyces sp. NPDC047706 TaxID=3365486 RepID=UPI00371EA6BB
MDGHRDPEMAIVLDAVKSTVKGGIGTLREQARGGGWRTGQAWPALARPTWRPDIRAAVISRARVNMHRKTVALAAATGRYPARKTAASTGGIVIDTRARSGYTAAPGTTDDARLRHLTVALPPPYAARLFEAQEQGATEQQLRHIAAEGLGEIYFRDRDRRAHGLDVEFTDVEHIDFDL